MHPLDKTGSVYYNYCKKHTNPKNDYVGETDRVNRERGYEHGIIDHKTAKRSASLDYGDEQPERRQQQEQEEAQEIRTGKTTKAYKKDPTKD